MNSLAAGMFFENFQIAQTFGSPTFRADRPAPRLRHHEGLLEDLGVGEAGRVESRDGVVDPAGHARGEETVVGGVVPGEDLRRHALVEQRLAELSDSRISLESIKMFCPDWDRSP